MAASIEPLKQRSNICVCYEGEFRGSKTCYPTIKKHIVERFHTDEIMCIQTNPKVTIDDSVDLTKFVHVHTYANPQPDFTLRFDKLCDKYGYSKENWRTSFEKITGSNWMLGFSSEKPGTCIRRMYNRYVLLDILKKYDYEWIVLTRSDLHFVRSPDAAVLFDRTKIVVAAIGSYGHINNNFVVFHKDHMQQVLGYIHHFLDTAFVNHMRSKNYEKTNEEGFFETMMQLSNVKHTKTDSCWYISADSVEDHTTWATIKQNNGDLFKYGDEYKHAKTHLSVLRSPTRNSASDKIPNIIHFVFGLAEQTDEFLFAYYVAILSALIVNSPDRIYFHYHYEPHGKWWSLVKKYVILNKIEMPTSIGSKPLLHVAHKADVVRMQQLIRMGGVYMDIDTITVRPYAELLGNNTVLARQDNGICNAVMLSAPGSEFMLEWMGVYEQHFNPHGWEESSIKLPALLVQGKCESTVKVLDEKYFFKPGWRQWRTIFEDSTEIHDELMTLHLWEKFSLPYLKQVQDGTYVDTHNNLYAKMLRKLMETYNVQSYFMADNFDCLAMCPSPKPWNASSWRYSGVTGKGSTYEFNKDTLIPFINDFVHENAVTTVVDLGCGEASCVRQMYGLSNARYVGYDICISMIKDLQIIHNSEPSYNFVHLNVLADKHLLAAADLCIIKDVLQHFPTASLVELLDYLTTCGKYKYVMVINCYDRKITDTVVDINFGQWRPLRASAYPLNKYRGAAVYHYETKQVFLIVC